MIGFGQTYTHKMDSIITYYNNQVEQKIEFSYDANNNNNLCLIYSDPLLTLQGKIENTYDANNNLVLLEVFYWNNSLSVWQLDNYTEYTYDINNNLILRERFEWNASLSVWEVEKNEYTYNINNNLIISTHYDWNTVISSYEISAKSEFTYDINNNLILRESFYWDTILSIWDSQGKSEYTYDANNNNNLCLFYSDSLLTLQGKIEYSYDVNNNMITSTHYDWNGVAWVYYISNNFTYDLSLLTNNIAYPFSRNEFVSEYEKIYYNPISTSDHDGYYNFYYSPLSTSGVLNTAGNSTKLLKVIDVLGRETSPAKNTPLFYINDDGTVEKRIVIE